MKQISCEQDQFDYILLFFGGFFIVLLWGASLRSCLDVIVFNPLPGIRSYEQLGYKAFGTPGKMAAGIAITLQNIGGEHPHEIYDGDFYCLQLNSANKNYRPLN